MQIIITATVLLENSLWVAIFERSDNTGIAAARQIFGAEPSDAELYEFVKNHYQELRFSEPTSFKLMIKRKNPKRIQREVRQELAKMKAGAPKETRAQEILRLDLEKHKKLKKAQSSEQKIAEEKVQFLQRQTKKKKKLRGH